jgi:hypothetical protein
MRWDSSFEQSGSLANAERPVDAKGLLRGKGTLSYPEEVYASDDSSQTAFWQPETHTLTLVKIK